MDEIRNAVVEILKDLHPEIDIENCTTLIDDKIIDSFDIVSIISEIGDAWDVSVPADKIVPENFNSADAIAELVANLIDGD